ncbi:3-oxoacyl-ACP synthase [Paenibacillus sp. J53TS2]|uniref:3-oxoacyl-ACP synthase III family protein n=1 Tax=Paenibacillus sp. J53TS2 TaxID=2807197 RepID=UPI001B0BD290|nr:ketoacyl-ACP synthase III [Paenibacillus sp. J53TS2]GIP47415.1 3-oxoacyl-ACP synthase [Paenibacillus sp. J53TS2]
MTTQKIDRANIAGICCALPGEAIAINDLNSSHNEKELKKFTKMTGVQTVYRVQKGQTTSDLCLAAAEKLLADLKWDRSSIDGLVFISQTPDYVLPATSCILQDKLGLSTSSFAFDINLGCSGFVYGTWIVSKLLSPTCRRVLLLNGDTSSRIISPEDASVSLLFGDAGAATAFEYNENATKSSFILGTDGSGYNRLIVPGGSGRNPRDSQTHIRKQDHDGVIRSKDDLYMNGIEIFNFTLKEVQPLIQSILDVHGWSEEDVDYYILHQANKFLLEQLTRKFGVSKEKVPINIQDYGNTSSASIPLMLVDVLKERNPQDKDLNLVLAGFGVGLSWAAAAINISKTICSDLVYV